MSDVSGRYVSALLLCPYKMVSQFVGQGFILFIIYFLRRLTPKHALFYHVFFTNGRNMVPIFVRIRCFPAVKKNQKIPWS